MILLVKLHNFCGIRGNLRSFEDYRSVRLQRVTVLGVKSKPIPVLPGVSQGSICEPLLFFIYVNNLPKSTSHDTTVTMFADDTKFHRHLRNFQDTIILDSLASCCVMTEKWTKVHVVIHFSSMQSYISQVCSHTFLKYVVIHFSSMQSYISQVCSHTFLKYAVIHFSSM